MSAFRWRIKRVSVTASTNDDCLDAADRGEDEGLVIHALQQTAGRGRHGRSWESPVGNLYCSVLLRPAIPAAGHFSLVAALALADTVKEFAPQHEVRLKWPNDVLLGGSKISGILIEAGENCLVIGMGLNIDHHPDNALYPATSLTAHGIRPRVDNVLDTLLQNLAVWYERLRQNGFAPVREAWLKQALTGPLIVKLPTGPVAGEFVDIDAHGYLRLKLADGAEKVISAGDVFTA